MSKTIVILDDTCKRNSGGTALTLKALAQSLSEYKFIFVETHELNEELLYKIPKNNLWIIGNVTNLNEFTIKYLYNILLFRKFCKIEFDYGFCKYRCEYGFKKFTKLDKWEPFHESLNTEKIQNIYFLIHKMAKKVFYMSHAQKQLHEKILNLDESKSDKRKVLGSCFSVQDLMEMVKFGSDRKQSSTKSDFIKNKVYAIVDGNGGWHSEAKGFKESISYAKNNNLKFAIIKQPDYKKFIQDLSNFYGLIFLPLIHDTCPRLVIEAKLLGLELIVNDNCQHINEDWFLSKKDEDLANYLLDRPYFFKKEINEYL